jgi:urease subunit alpha
VEGAEPTRYRADWGGTGRSAASLSTTFVSGRAVGSPDLRRHGRSLVAVRETRDLTRDALLRNRRIAAIDVDVRDGTVTLNGRPLAIDPVTEVPLSRRYLLR